MKITQMMRPVSLGVIAALSLSLMACNQDKPADTKSEAPAANADQKQKPLLIMQHLPQAMSPSRPPQASRPSLPILTLSLFMT